MGLSLLAAFGAGKIAKYLKIPKVTGYILTGLIFGPSLFNIIPRENVKFLGFVSDIALGLILFNIGGEFHRELLKKIGRRMVKLAAGLSLSIFLSVGTLCFGFSFILDLSLGQRLFFSTFLATIAMDSAPATTLLVIREYESKGTLTDHLIVYLAMATLAATVGSEILWLVFESFGTIGHDPGQLLNHALHLLWRLAGSMLCGMFLGLALSFFEQKEKSHSEMLMAVVCTILIGITAAHQLGLEPMLISLFLGFSLVNFSHSGNEIHEQIRGVGLSIYALFFVLAGAQIEIDHLKTAGIFGLVYFFARFFGVLIGARLCCRALNEEDVLQRYLGPAMLAHATIALGIVSKLEAGSNAIVDIIIHSVISAVLIFEILGPISLRWALIRAREVTVASILSDASTGLSLGLRDMIMNFMVNTGLIKPEHHGKDQQTVADLMTRKIYAINSGANFEEVVKYIDDHHFPIYPVVRKGYLYEGLINFNEVKNVMFDPFLSRLIVASDLIGHRGSLTSLAKPDEAEIVFRETGLDALPVVDSKSTQLVGIVRHKDILVALRSNNMLGKNLI